MPEGKLRWHRRPDCGHRWAETVSTACYQRGLGQAAKPAESVFTSVDKAVGQSRERIQVYWFLCPDDSQLV